MDNSTAVSAETTVVKKDQLLLLYGKCFDRLFLSLTGISDAKNTNHPLYYKKSSFSSGFRNIRGQKSADLVISEYVADFRGLPWLVRRSLTRTQKEPRRVPWPTQPWNLPWKCHKTPQSVQYDVCGEVYSSRDIYVYQVKHAVYI